jgi:hypothetical protein
MYPIHWALIRTIEGTSHKEILCKDFFWYRIDSIDPDRILWSPNQAGVCNVALVYSQRALWLNEGSEVKFEPWITSTTPSDLISGGLETWRPFSTILRALWITVINPIWWQCKLIDDINGNLAKPQR